MGSSRVVVLGLMCLALGVGCRSVRGVRMDARQPLVLTADEAQHVRREALKLKDGQPHELTRMKQAAQMLEQVARSLPEDYDAQWQAAEALAFPAENDTCPELRIQAAKLGMTLARHGQESKPSRVECHYWYAINVGLLADADRTYGLNAVSEMETALKRAIDVDERYDYGGPLRVLGILHLRTPAPPVSIGSPRKGLRLLQRAAELFPDYPENLLYLAEALRDNDRRTEACELVKKVIESPPWPNRQFESADWKANAQKLLPCSPTK